MSFVCIISMASADPKVASISCPQCGARYQFPPAMAGKRGQCVSCGTTFTVAAPMAEPPAAPVTAAEPPQYIGVYCRVCQTRMYGTLDQVGKMLKCPDCGARTELPPPPKPKPKKLPAALQGDQYELWDVDEQPLPSALVAVQPKYIAISCRKCATLMYAGEHQVGQTIVCPDCGTKHTVPPAPAQKQVRSVLAADTETPALDPSRAPGERPLAALSKHQMLHEVERAAELAAIEEQERRTGVRVVDSRGRRIMPRWPLVTGVWRMLVTEEVIARWILLSIVLGFAAQFLGEALLTPIQGMAEAIKLVFVVLGGGLAIAWLAMAAPFFVAMIAESAEGEDRVHEPPRLLAFDWFVELFSVFMAASMAGLCGLGAWHLAQLASLSSTSSAAIVTMIVIGVFPVALLSTLLEGTPFGVISWRLVKSIGRGAGVWFVFYAQTFVLAALVVAVGTALWYLLNLRPGDEATLFWLSGPVAIAALFIDMRLLGRLAWWLSKRIPDMRDENGSEQSY